MNTSTNVDHNLQIIKEYYAHYLDVKPVELISRILCIPSKRRLKPDFGYDFRSVIWMVHFCDDSMIISVTPELHNKVNRIIEKHGHGKSLYSDSNLRALAAMTETEVENVQVARIRKISLQTVTTDKFLQFNNSLLPNSVRIRRTVRRQNLSDTFCSKLRDTFWFGKWSKTVFLQPS
jgi:hypothetical protein